MSTLSEVITASYTTSKDAEQVGKRIKTWLGCDHNYEIARLALGRSLMLEDVPPAAPDSKSLPLKGLQLFGSEADANYLWIALLGEQLRLYGHPQFTLEGLQQLIRDHWHRGVYELEKDWLEAGENEASLVDRLVRRGALPETAPDWVEDAPSATTSTPASASDEECNLLLKKLRGLGIAAEIRSSVIGPRLTRFRLYLADTRDYAQLENRLDELGFSLGTGQGSISLSQADEPQTCFLDLPRKSNEWQPATLQQFEAAMRTFEALCRFQWKLTLQQT